MGLRVYRENPSDRVVVIEADQFRFYMNSTSHPKGLNVVTLIVVVGQELDPDVMIQG